MDKKLSIAIAGAGMSALAVALFLHRAGHSVCIYEAFEKPAPVGSGLMLQPTGLSVLAELGLADAILSMGNRIDRLVGNDAASGRVVLDVSYERQKTGRFGLAVHRTALFDVLYKAVKAEGIEMRFSHPVTDREEQGDKVSPLVDGQAQQPVDLLIDCCGGHSPLRRSVLPYVEQRKLAYGAFWTTLDWVGEAFDPHALQQRYDKASVMIGVLPVGYCPGESSKKAAFFWSLKACDADDVRAEGIDAWKGKVRGYWPQTAPYLDQISDFDQLTLAGYGHHTLKTVYTGRVLHLGDSAHSTSPQLGQGANMALLDAASFAFALAASNSVDEALTAHQKARRWHVKVYQALSYLLTPFYQSDSIAIPKMRDLLMGSVARVPPAPALLRAMVAGTLVDPLAPIGLSHYRGKD
ncbi:FAD-dependent oxidoreductase [Pseudahrensia aquimaris]|uniref:FAD-dependent oxidoreductase n=1 Tax=Pseudahrensia aquimaris TaxID=744461 RepID=A0ABW3FL30_9HYPH